MRSRPGSYVFNFEPFYPKNQIPYPFLNSLKFLECAANQDVLLLTTLLYLLSKIMSKFYQLVLQSILTHQKENQLMSWPVKKCGDGSIIKVTYQEKIGFNLEKQRFTKGLSPSKVL